MQSKGQNQDHLRNEQYKSSINLSARAQLHHRFTTNPYGWFKWVFDQFEAPTNATLLELGAGPGWLWKENADRIPPGWTITLSDLSAGMVAEQRQNLTNVRHPFSFEVIDAQSIPYEDASLDLVNANHMLYHVPDLPRALAEIARVLKPTGKLYAATNGTRHMIELEDLVRNYSPTHEGLIDKLAFTLEKGTSDLALFFDDITVQRYEDALEVTEVEPLIAYVLSTVRLRTDGIDSQPDEFSAYMRREFRKTNTFHITKNIGLFTAKPRTKNKS